MLASRWERQESSLGKRDCRLGRRDHRGMLVSTEDLLGSSRRDWMETQGFGEHRERPGWGSTQDCRMD